MRETLRGLLAPRRLIPILAVTFPLLVAQTRLSEPRVALPLGIAMCTAFVFIAPVSFRVLFPDGLQRSWSLVRIVLYVAIGAGAVLSIGAVVPKLADINVTFMTARATLAICLALFLVGGWGLGRDIGFERSLEHERARSLALAREAERAQLLALRAQLDPHFLFNTLNAIAEWCREDGAVAERAVLQLSSILRAILDGVKTAAWPLAREIELIQTLFALHLLRDPSLFEATIDIEAAARAVPLPPLVLLPIAENAMKHGPCAGNRGRVVITARAADGQLRIRLENPGAFSGRRVGGSGLEMAERRLRLAYGDEASLRIAQEGVRTRVDILLPLGGPLPGGTT